MTRMTRMTRIKKEDRAGLCLCAPSLSVSSVSSVVDSSGTDSQQRIYTGRRVGYNRRTTQPDGEDLMTEKLLSRRRLLQAGALGGLGLAGPGLVNAQVDAGR